MLTKHFLLKLFEAADMQRWNDQIRPVDLRELDKQAHKMIISYVLGKFEEENKTPDFDWINIIEGGLFEFLQRIVITDLKPQVFHKIKHDKEKYLKLNEWVYKEIETILSPVGEDFKMRFKAYLLDTQEDIHKRILSAAHFYATKWEFDIIERANPDGYEILQIKKEITAKQERYYDLKGIQQLSLYSHLRHFVDLCGQLRCQIRWSHLHRIPKTSVLGHMLIVAMFSYLCSRQMSACRQRCINNYFTGLFHDLPEALTRDIGSPVKKSVRGLDALIKEYEKKEMEQKVLPLIPVSWHPDIRMYVENEFESVIEIKGRKEIKTSEEIGRDFNEDQYNPRDGQLVKACDHLAAFIEAFLAIENGSKNEKLKEAKSTIRKNYQKVIIGGVDFSKIYEDFE